MPVRRALDYPYDIPTGSYIIEDGCVQDWHDDVDLSARHAVFACGSNQSPTQLKRKFPTGKIPVMAGWLKDYDSVYSAHFTSYGSVAATYHPAIGVRSRQMITWLDDAQLEIMHKSEALGVNYTFEELPELSFISDCNKIIKTGFSYQSIRGPLYFDGQPVGLKTIKVDKRPYPSLHQEDLQQKIMPMMSDHNDLSIFIQETISDATIRQLRTKKLVDISTQ